MPGAWRLSITVNAVGPGWAENSVLNSLPDQVQDLIRNWRKSGWTPMGRLGTPEDIGNVVALVCSEQAGWITGQVIYVDGAVTGSGDATPGRSMRAMSMAISSDCS